MDDDDCRAPFALLINSVDGRGRQYHLLPSLDAVIEQFLVMCEAEVIEKRNAEALEKKQAAPNIVEYDIATILNFLDTRVMEVVVFEATAPGVYASYGKTWLKKRAVDYLLRNVENSDDEG
jgi:hypothetical protein